MDLEIKVRDQRGKHGVEKMRECVVVVKEKVCCCAEKESVWGKEENLKRKDYLSNVILLKKGK